MPCVSPSMCDNNRMSRAHAPWTPGAAVPSPPAAPAAMIRATSHSCCAANDATGTPTNVDSETFAARRQWQGPLRRPMGPAIGPDVRHGISMPPNVEVVGASALLGAVWRRGVPGAKSCAWIVRSVGTSGEEVDIGRPEPVIGTPTCGLLAKFEPDAILSKRTASRTRRKEWFTTTRQETSRPPFGAPLAHHHRPSEPLTDLTIEVRRLETPQGQLRRAARQHPCQQ